MKRIRKCASHEDGNILILFAGFLVLIIFMIGLMLDLGMIYMRRNDLMDLCQVAREERLSRQDSIRYAENPGELTYDIVSNSVRKNGFKGTVKVYFYEKEPEWNDRSYKVRVVLSEEYHYTFLRILPNVTSSTITVYLDGIEEYGDKRDDLDDMIWHPTGGPNGYNGSYTGTDPEQPSQYEYKKGDLPDSMLT